MKLSKKGACGIVAALVICAFFATGCDQFGGGYEIIPQEEAARIMEDNKDALIVDVRTQEEFDEKHIKGAVCVPIEDLKEGKFDALPDKDRELLLYCRTGRRAEDASKLLVKEGYTNIKEFGGILNWEGETEGKGEGEKK